MKWTAKWAIAWGILIVSLIGLSYCFCERDIKIAKDVFRNPSPKGSYWEQVFEIGTKCDMPWQEMEMGYFTAQCKNLGYMKVQDDTVYLFKRIYGRCPYCGEEIFDMGLATLRNIQGERQFKKSGYSWECGMHLSPFLFFNVDGDVAHNWLRMGRDADGTYYHRACKRRHEKMEEKESLEELRRRCQ